MFNLRLQYTIIIIIVVITTKPTTQPTIIPIGGYVFDVSYAADAFFY